MKLIGSIFIFLAFLATILIFKTGTAYATACANCYDLAYYDSASDCNTYCWGYCVDQNGGYEGWNCTGTPATHCNCCQTWTCSYSCGAEDNTCRTCPYYSSCSACIVGDPYTCGWNGSSCETGTSSCPTGYSEWYWLSCSTNVCPTPTPTPTTPTSTPTRTPTPTAAPSCSNNPAGCDVDLSCDSGVHCDCYEECSSSYSFCWGSSTSSYACNASCATAGNYTPAAADCCYGLLWNPTTKQCYAPAATSTPTPTPTTPTSTPTRTPTPTPTPACPAPIIDGQNYGYNQNYMWIELRKEGVPARVTAYESKWCMHEHGAGDDFSNSLCCTKPTGCSSIETWSPWDDVLTDYRHVDIEEYPGTPNDTPNGLFSSTEYNMRVRSVCGTTNTSAWAPFTTDAFGCFVSGGCHTTDTNCTPNTTPPLPPFQTEGNQRSDSITYSGGGNSCIVQLSPYGLDTTQEPDRAVRYGNDFKYATTSAGINTVKWEMDDNFSGTCDLDYGASYSWVKGDTDADTNTDPDWLAVSSKTYRKDADDSSNIGIIVKKNTCSLKKWNGTSFVRFADTKDTLIIPNAQPGDSLAGDILGRTYYDVDWCGDGEVDTDLNEVCDPPGSQTSTLCPGSTTAYQTCSSSCQLDSSACPIPCDSSHLWTTSGSQVCCYNNGYSWITGSSCPGQSSASPITLTCGSTSNKYVAPLSNSVFFKYVSPPTRVRATLDIQDSTGTDYDLRVKDDDWTCAATNTSYCGTSNSGDATEYCPSSTGFKDLTNNANHCFLVNRYSGSTDAWFNVKLDCSVTIQGHHVDKDENDLTTTSVPPKSDGADGVTDQNVSDDVTSGATTSSPTWYFNNLLPGAHTITADATSFPGYDITSSLCDNCTTHTTASYTGSNVVTVSSAILSAGGNYADIFFKYSPKACTVSTSPTSLSLVGVGTTGAVTASVSSPGLYGATVSQWTFASSAPAVATVTNSASAGTATAVALGSTTISSTATLSDGRTCTSNGTTAVTVRNPNVAISGHHVNAAGTDLSGSTSPTNVGQTVTLTGAGTGSSSVSPIWSFPTLSPGTYTVTATIIAGYDTYFSLNGSAYSLGNSVSAPLPADGNSASIYFKYVPVVMIQGHFVDAAGQFVAAGTRTISITGGALTSAVAPAYGLSPNNLWKKDSLTPSSTSYFTVTASTVTGYDIYYTLCPTKNSAANCASNTPFAWTKASSVALPFYLNTANDWTDIYFKYVSIYSISGTVFKDTNKDRCFNSPTANAPCIVGTEVKADAETFTISPVPSTDGTVTYPASGDNYKISGLAAGMHTFTITGLPAGWDFTYPPASILCSNENCFYQITVGPTCSTTTNPSFDTNGASCDTSPGSLNSVIHLNAGITNDVDTWFQSIGSDLRWDSGITGPGKMVLPENQFASLPGSGGMPGIIFSGATSFLPADQASATYNWHVGSPANSDVFTTSHSLIPTSYTFFKETAEGSNIWPTTTITSLTGITSNGIYKVEGTGGTEADLNINAEYTFTGNKNYVILVHGNLNINSNIKVDSGSTVVFSVSKNITVGASVTEIEGLYSADRDFTVNTKTISSCTDGVIDSKLNVAGTVVANAGRGTGTFVNSRTFCGGNISNPSVTFTERPDFMLNYPSMVKQISRTWQDIAP